MVAVNEYPRASNATVVGGILTYIAGVFLLMSFSSPYWVKSHEESFSSFKNMGLWEYCFDNFRFPNYQFDKLFHGCHYIFSHEFYVIREWLLPGWLMIVQAFVSLAFLLSFVAQIIFCMQVTRLPLEFVLKYEYMLSGIACVCTALCSCFLFLAVAIFGGEVWRRDWLMYPNFNFLGWSYGLAIVALFLHGVASFFIYADARRNYEIMKESKNLMNQMHPNGNPSYDL